jgi:hypothetical protein
MPRDVWTMSLLADQGAYRGDYPWDEQPSGPLLPPPRNPARDIPEAALPGLSQPYAPRAQAPLPEAGKVPTSDPWMMGAVADTANMLGYAIPGPAGAAKAAPLIVAGIRKALPAAEEAAGKGIRAYHSSPHDFERFDASKIGTGEGAQVYGHGHYFAENPAVSGQGGQYWTNFQQRFSGPEARAASVLKYNNFDREAAIAALEGERAWFQFNIKEGTVPRAMEETARILKELEQASALLESGKSVGPRTYEVAIKARPEQMLDWDAGLNRQSPHVQEALSRRLGIKSDPAAMKAYDDALYDALHGSGASPRLKPPFDPSGATIYRDKIGPSSVRRNN